MFDVITKASKPENLSWCTCSEEICENQLGGKVAWNMQGEGWKGYKPKKEGVIAAVQSFSQNQNLAELEAGRRAIDSKLFY